MLLRGGAGAVESTAVFLVGTGSAAKFGERVQTRLPQISMTHAGAAQSSPTPKAPHREYMI